MATHTKYHRDREMRRYRDYVCRECYATESMRMCKPEGWTVTGVDYVCGKCMDRHYAVARYREDVREMERRRLRLIRERALRNAL